MKIFKSSIIQKQLKKEELQALESDFRRYKQFNHIPSTFGRDALYDHPNTLPSVKEEEIRHIHLIDPQDWHIKIIQFNKTSDKHLVYCQGFFDQNAYLLMVILAPDAHDQAKQRSLMWKLAEMAHAFREKH